MELGIVKAVDINEEVQNAYLDYAMSVIVARALPDVRDGLKPVQRRILYAMHDMHLYPEHPYKKSARIVGEVLGKYHPHGDAAVYDAMARMAQDFSLRHLLVDGQGNFGSVDGDAPAAMRYTEARLAPLAMELLNDIEKNTVEWDDNFDGSLKEPRYLPASFPNLLINGASGIAVGMSTNIPPHNLGEVVDALVYMLEQWEKLDNVTVEDLLRHIKGPDFPTGGIVYRRENGEDTLLQAYATGKGRITIHARAHLEELRGGRQSIIVTELPYQVNKSALIESIAELARAGKIEGLADLRDESDRQGMRLIIELSRGADVDKVLRELYRHTALETRYSVILLALVNGEPRRLSLKKILQLFLEHRLDVIVRRTRFDLQRAEQQAHILEGLLIALKNLDEVIEIIRRSRRVDTARENLRKRFKLTEIQAQAILDMPLKRLAALERQKIEEDYKALLALIAELRELLATPAKQRAAIREELLALKQRYADPRRTHVLEQKGDTIVLEDLVPDTPVWLTVTREGLVARAPKTDKAPHPAARPAAAPLALLAASTRDALLLLTAEGKAVALPVHLIPEGLAWEGAGAAWTTLAKASSGTLVSALSIGPASSGTLFMVTAQGQVKRLEVSELPAVGREAQAIIRLDAGDSLVAAALVDEKDEVLLASAQAQGIRFAVAEVRPTGLSAGGMAGIKLEEGDRVVGLSVVRSSGQWLTVTRAGYGKRFALQEISAQRRGGKGVLLARLDTNDALAAVACLPPTVSCILVTVNGATKTLTPRSIPEQGRLTRGESIISVRGKDAVERLISTG